MANKIGVCCSIIDKVSEYKSPSCLEIVLFIVVYVLIIAFSILIFMIAFKYFFRDKKFYKGYIDGLNKIELNNDERDKKTKNYLKGYSKGYTKNREKK